MKNYRPISLLNVDYKIISKAISLTNKLQPHMSKLIHADQQCSIVGRKIQNHLHFIRDIITYTKEKQMQAAIISLDQEKAFDRVAHDYLFKTITAHNLGTHIETWIKTLYKIPQSQLLVNSTTLLANLSTSTEWARRRHVAGPCPFVFFHGSNFYSL